LTLTACPTRAQTVAAQPEPGKKTPSDATPLRLPASGGDGHGWFALPGEAALTFPTLYHLPPGSEPGTVRGGPRLTNFPEMIASSEDRVVLVMPRERIDPAKRTSEPGQSEATSEPSPPARLIRRVQTLRVVKSSAGLWDYFPRGREPVALPSLPGRGELRGVVRAESTLFALIQGAPRDDSQFADASAREDLFLVLREGEVRWESFPLPVGWEVESSAAIVTSASRIVLLQGDAAWQAPSRAAARGVPGVWSPVEFGAVMSGASFATAGSSIIVAHAEPDRITLDLLREGTTTRLGVIDHAAEQYAIIGGGDLLTVIWRGEGDPTRLRATVISAITGDVLFDDFAKTNAVVSGREIQSLGLLVGALMLTILVFVLRPEEALGGVVLLPDGFALASPLRRVLAVLLDLAPSLVASALIFHVSGRELLDAAVLSDNSTTRGALALGAAFLLTGVQCTLGEWLFGRTIGKAICRCRTISVRGERPKLWQAALRTFVKLLFPPFALFLFLDLRRRHPGDLVAGTAVIQRRRPGAEGDGDEPPPS
jgi:uncharacterized RDD family membrane protein YckC